MWHLDIGQSSLVALYGRDDLQRVKFLLNFKSFRNQKKNCWSFGSVRMFSINRRRKTILLLGRNGNLLSASENYFGYKKNFTTKYMFWIICLKKKSNYCFTIILPIIITSSGQKFIKKMKTSQRAQCYFFKNKFGLM